MPTCHKFHECISQCTWRSLCTYRMTYFLTALFIAHNSCDESGFISFVWLLQQFEIFKPQLTIIIMHNIYEKIYCHKSNEFLPVDGAFGRCTLSHFSQTAFELVTQAQSVRIQTIARTQPAIARKSSYIKLTDPCIVQVNVVGHTHFHNSTSKTVDVCKLRNATCTTDDKSCACLLFSKLQHEIERESTSTLRVHVRTCAVCLASWVRACGFY